MRVRKSTLALVIIVVSATTQLASSSSFEPNRWLTDACNSKTDGGRRLLSRILTHACDTPSQQATANEIYNKNTNTTRGSNTFVNVTLGVLAGMITILGLIFFIDRETFTQITGVEEVPCKCSKPRIEGDENDISEPTKFEQDTYHLTKETQDYLAEKNEREVEQPKRRLRSMFGCFFKTKDHGDEDKYNIAWNASEDEKKAGNVNLLLVFWEDVRLRLCWKPTKEYENKNGDKYAVNLSELNNQGEGSTEQVDDEIPYAVSSYESAEAGMSPW